MTGRADLGIFHQREFRTLGQARRIWGNIMVDGCKECERCAKHKGPMTWKRDSEGFWLATVAALLLSFFVLGLWPIFNRMLKGNGPTSMTDASVIIMLTIFMVGLVLTYSYLLLMFSTWHRRNVKGHFERMTLGDDDQAHVHISEGEDPISHMPAPNGGIWYRVGFRCSEIALHIGRVYDPTTGNPSPHWTVSHAWSGSWDIQIKDQSGHVLGPNLPPATLLHIIRHFNSLSDLIEAGLKLKGVQAELEQMVQVADHERDRRERIGRDLGGVIVFLRACKGTVNSPVAGPAHAMLEGMFERYFTALDTKFLQIDQFNLEGMLTELPEGLQRKARKLMGNELPA